MLVKIMKNKQALIGLGMIVITLTVAILAPVIAPNDPNQIEAASKFASCSFRYPLGTDQLGRCIFSRLIYGARVSLGLSIPALLLIMAISLLVGTISAYAGGRVDEFFSIVFDIFMAFPPLLVVISLVGALGQGITNMMIAVIFSTWVWYVKIVRSYILMEKKKDYVTAARICGCSDVSIIMKHMIPNVFPALLVFYSTGVAGMIIMISGFSFLGLGIGSGIPEWGSMLNNGKSYLYSHPNLIALPGLCILFAAGGFNLFGEALRDIISPEEA